MNYQEFTTLIKENRKKIAFLKSHRPTEYKLKVTRFNKINDLLNERNALIMERHQLLVKRAKHIQNFYPAKKIKKVG